MFRGSATATIDAKGRFKLPTSFHRVLKKGWKGAEVFVTSLRGDAGLFYPLPVWEDLEKRLLGLPATDTGRQLYLERANYFGQQAELDAQGRLVLPAILRQSAELSGEVVVFGNVDHLQIWNRDRFERRLQEVPWTDEHLGDLAAKGV